MAKPTKYGAAVRRFTTTLNRLVTLTKPSLTATAAEYVVSLVTDPGTQENTPSVTPDPVGPSTQR